MSSENAGEPGKNQFGAADEDADLQFADESNARVDPRDQIYDFKDSDDVDVNLSEAFDSSKVADPTDIYEPTDLGNVEANFGEIDSDEDIYAFKDDGGGDDDLAFADDFVREEERDEFDLRGENAPESVDFSDSTGDAPDIYDPTDLTEKGEAQRPTRRGTGRFRPGAPGAGTPPVGAPARQPGPKRGPGLTPPINNNPAIAQQRTGTPGAERPRGHMSPSRRLRRPNFDAPGQPRPAKPAPGAPAARPPQRNRGTRRLAGIPPGGRPAPGKTGRHATPPRTPHVGPGRAAPVRNAPQGRPVPGTGTPGQQTPTIRPRGTRRLAPLGPKAQAAPRPAAPETAPTGEPQDHKRNVARGSARMPRRPIAPPGPSDSLSSYKPRSAQRPRAASEDEEPPFLRK